MLGYGNRVGRNAGVHDDLAAQALVLSDGANKVAIAGVDVLALGTRIADDIRERVATGTDIHADSILICATHTHSAPAFNIFATPRADAKPAEGRDLAWERALPEKIAICDRSGQRKSRTRDASRCRRPVHARNQSPPDASASPNSDRRKSLRPGRCRSQRARCISRRRNVDRVPDELSMPRRRAMRGQPALFARLARLRDG